jgi:hypothetical protein
MLRSWVPLPPPVHFFLRGNYGIKSGLFLNNNCWTNLAASTATTSTNTTTEQQPDFDLSKEFMTTKAQLLALVNRLEHVEKELMMRKYI